MPQQAHTAYLPESILNRAIKTTLIGASKRCRTTCVSGQRMLDKCKTYTYTTHIQCQWYQGYHGT